MDTFSLLRDALSQRMNIEPERVKPETLLTELGVDSLMLLELIFELEEKLGVTVPQDVETPETCAQLVEIVDRLRTSA